MNHPNSPIPSDLPIRVRTAFAPPHIVLASPFLRGFAAGFTEGTQPPDLLQTMLVWPSELEPAEVPDLGPIYENGFRFGYREARLGRN